MDLSQLRNEFRQAHLDELQVASEPIAQFKVWFEQALATKCTEPNAMCLATVSPEGHPSDRIVYLKGIESDCFLFFTNYESRKGQDLAKNPWVSAMMFWPNLERQVRIEGTVSRLPEQESDAYFASRPRASQLGAWASCQSQIIANRATLEKNLQEMSTRYPQEIPRPAYWGGYRIEPIRVEFWQGRPGRMHDRLCYQFHEDSWRLKRLSP